MIDVIAHAKAPFNELGDPWTGPKLGVKPRGLRPFEQQRLELTLVLGAQLRRAAWRRRGAYARLAVSPCRSSPAPHTAPINANATRHLNGQQSVLEQGVYCYYNLLTTSWDEPKRRGNIEAHGLDFEGAEAIWDNFTITREDTREDYGEKRMVTFGFLHGEVVVLVHTDRGDDMHVIFYAKLRNMKRAITLKPPKRISAKVVDRDNPPWSEEMLGPPVLRRGRGPQKAPTKVLTTLRLDADVIAFFRAQGPGYQSRINEALRRVKEGGLTTGSTAIARKRAAR